MGIDPSEDHQEPLSDEDIRELREEIAEALAELKRGEGAEWDAAKTKAELIQRFRRGRQSF